MTAGSVESLRSRNRRAVLAAVQAHPRSSRAQIARTTGLSTSTVSTLVAELVDGDVLIELGETPAGRGTGGRPATSLGINPRAGAVLGIHLGHAGTRVVLTAPDGTVQAEHAEPFDVDHEPQRSLARVGETARALIEARGPARDKMLGAGVAVSAPVLDARVLASPPMLLDWGGVDLGRALHAELGLPVHLGNDATLGAMAEWRLGAGRGTENLIYVMLSEGVGAGLILGGQVHEGVSGAAGEFGHVRVTPSGQICRCGNRGCLETVVGARALVTALAHTRGPQFGVDDLLQAVTDGDVGARRLLAEAGRAVGDALAGICTVLDPGLVVLGGSLTGRPAAADALVDSARSALDQALPPVGNHAVQVRSAMLGERSEALGAALLAASRAQAQIAALADAS